MASQFGLVSFNSIKHTVLPTPFDKKNCSLFNPKRFYKHTVLPTPFDKKHCNLFNPKRSHSAFNTI